jgi:carbon storage regulator CsrA
MLLYRRFDPARQAAAHEQVWIGPRRMLYLTRKIGESVIINDDIEITVVEIRSRSIKLGFTFPPEASVLRREIFERIQKENQVRAQSK